MIPRGGRPAGGGDLAKATAIAPGLLCAWPCGCHGGDCNIGLEWQTAAYAQSGHRQVNEDSRAWLMTGLGRLVPAGGGPLAFVGAELFAVAGAKSCAVAAIRLPILIRVEPPALVMNGLFVVAAAGSSDAGPAKPTAVVCAEPSVIAGGNSDRFCTASLTRVMPWTREKGDDEVVGKGKSPFPLASCDQAGS